MVASRPTEGEALARDVALPELPVGQDQTHLCVVDYGPHGRQQRGPTVRILRVRI